MKNKALKNLIALSIFAFSIFSVNLASASSLYYDSPSYDYNNYYGSNYNVRQQIIDQQNSFRQRQLQQENQLNSQNYYNEQQKIIQEQNLALQKQGLAVNNSNLNTVYYAQPQTQYVAQPVINQVKYVPTYTAQPTTTYLPASAQGASAYNSVSANKVKTSTGSYINFDPNMQAASAYGYNNGQVVGTEYDPNGVTALSMNGSGSFLPSSVFQWFMFVLLILAIIIVARMIIKKRAMNKMHQDPTH